MPVYEAVKRLNGNKRPDQHSTGGYGEPWFTRDSINILEDKLRPDFVCFEWGSGSSSIWIANRVASLFTVEHNPNWANMVQEAIQVTGLNEKVYLFQATLTVNYSTPILLFPDEHFDAIFIDGKERVACLENALPRLKSKGLVCIDNTEREHYREGTEVMDDWAQIETENEKWKTTIWWKP